MLCTCIHRVLCRSLSSRVKMAVFWVVAPCGPAEVDQRFRGTNCKSVHSCHLVAFSAILLTFFLSIWFRKVCRDLRCHRSPVACVLLSFPRCAIPVASCHVIQETMSALCDAARCIFLEFAGCQVLFIAPIYNLWLIMCSQHRLWLALTLDCRDRRAQPVFVTVTSEVAYLSFIIATFMFRELLLLSGTVRYFE
jgi:hypothetical protein